MAASDNVGLAELADQVAMTATEVLRLSEQISRTTKADDLHLDKTHTFARCVMDACSLLALQLRDLSSRDEAALKDANENFWPSFRAVVGLWLENTEKSVEILRNDPRIQTTLTVKIWQKLRAGAEYTAIGPPKLQEGTFGDAQMVTTLFALHKEMQKNITSESRLCRHFLACDLEWKATQLKMRMSHTRQELKLPLAWGQSHSWLVDASMDIVWRAKRELGVPAGDGKFVDADSA